MRDQWDLHEQTWPYIDELEGRFARLWDCWAVLRDGLDNDHYDCQKALRAFHKEVCAVKEIANSYGSFSLSSLVAGLEGHLEGILDRKVLLTQPRLEKLSAILSKMELQFLREVRVLKAKNSTDFKSQNPL